MKRQTAIFFVGRNCKVLFETLCTMTLFLAVFCVVGMSVPAHASGGAPAMGLQPAFYDPHHLITRSYFIFNSTPGTHFKSAVRVTNTGTAAGHASLYGTDATTGATSGAVYEEQNSKPQDVGSWIKMTTSSLILAPGQSRSIPFEVTIPRTVRPGEHLGGIAMEVTPVNAGTTPVQQKGQVQINTRIVTVVALEVILPGKPIEALTATGIQAGGVNNYQTMLLKLHNTGTMMVKSSGTLQLLDVHGTHLQTVPVNLDTFLPATSIDYPVYLKQAVGPGRYQAMLTLAYGNHHILRYDLLFTVTAQQVRQAFSINGTLPPPQRPQATVVNNSLPLWMLLVGSFFVLCGIFFLFQQSRRFILGARRRGEGTEG